MKKLVAVFALLFAAAAAAACVPHHHSGSRHGGYSGYYHSQPYVHRVQYSHPNGHYRPVRYQPLYQPSYHHRGAYGPGYPHNGAAGRRGGHRDGRP